MSYVTTYDILGPLELVTAPTTTPVLLHEAKLYLKHETEEDDPDIQRLIEAATEFCQQEVQGTRQFISATWDVRATGWWDELCLPRPPLQSVTSVKYYDENGTLQTLSTDYYLVRTPWRQPGVIERAPNQDWPIVQTDRAYPIVIRFVAGYGSTPASVPQTLRQAVMMLTATWADNPAAVISTGAIGKELPLSVRSLLDANSWGSYS